MFCKMATSCYGRISESGNRVTFVISAVRRTSAHQTLDNGSTAEPLRHRQTKGAERDMLSLTSPRHTSTLPTPAIQSRRVCANSGPLVSASAIHNDDSDLPKAASSNKLSLSESSCRDDSGQNGACTENASPGLAAKKTVRIAKTVVARVQALRYRGSATRSHRSISASGAFEQLRSPCRGM